MTKDIFAKNKRVKHRAEGNHFLHILENLFKPSTGKHVADRNALTPEQEGKKKLSEASKKLALLREQYVTKNYSGHPEEMLEAIESQSDAVKTLEGAKKRNWQPDEAAVQEIEADIAKQKQEFAQSSYPQDIVDNELGWRMRNLEEAKLGLR